MSTGGCSGSSISASNIPGSDNMQKAFNYFVGKGLTDIRAAAIVGNLMGESSSISPDSKQGGGGAGRGIAQWSSPGRWDTLVKFAGSRDPYDLATQLDFMWAELNHQAPAGDYTAALANLNKQDTIEDATAWFMGTTEAGMHKGNVVDSVTKSYIAKYGRFSGYENPGTPRLDVRISDAKDVLQLYGASSGAADAASASADTGGADTSSNSCANNVSSDISTTAQAGSGFIGNCAGKGSMAPIHCGQCVAYVEWALGAHADPKKGPYTSLTDQKGPLTWAASTVVKNLGSKGFTVDGTPAVHATFSMSGARDALDNHWGHTGIVSQVNTDAKGNLVSIVVEQSNWSPDGKELYNGDTVLTVAQLKKYHTTFAHTEVGWHD